MANDAYAELAELAGGFIHEIKNHLSTLGLNLQLLAEDFQEPQSQRERRALDRIQRLQGECQRLVDVSNDFLRFARIKDLHFAPTDLAEVVDELVDFFGPTARQANIEIKPYIPANLPPLSLDRELFKQALLNLMLNAQQAMPHGGTLTIQAERHPNGVSLALIDTGQGMTPEVMAKVFRPFFSGKPWLEEEHFRRLARSLEAIRIAGVDVGRLRQRMHETIRAGSFREATVYIQVTRGTAP